MVMRWVGAVGTCALVSCYVEPPPPAYPTPQPGGGVPVATAPVATAPVATAPVGEGSPFPTGVDASGNVLPDGAPDPHYQFTSNDPRIPGPTAMVVPRRGQWAQPGPGSTWISVDPSAITEDRTYTYTTQFTVRGDPAHASLHGVIACDDECTILLNDHVVDQVPVPAWPAQHQLTIAAGAPFVQGTNRLAFAVHNLRYITGLEVYQLTLTGD